MNWLDIAILVVIVGSAFMGLRTGIIKAAFSLAGLIVGVILAGRYYETLSQQLSFIPHDGAAKIVAFAIILVVVMVIARVLASVLKWVASLTMLGWVNRVGGAVFGLVLGAIFCSALLAIWVRYFGIDGAVAESSLATILLDRFPVILALLPDEFDAVRSFFH